MIRVSPVTDHQAGPGVRIGFWFTRRALARLTGRTPAGALDPLRVYARNPRLMRGYAGLERATAALTAVPLRLRALAELRAATLIACPYCIDLGSAAALRWGLTDPEILALPRYRTDPHFDSRDRAVLDYATAMTQTPADVPDVLVNTLREHLGEDQLLELTHVIALENLRGRFNLALGIEPAGFSTSTVCATAIAATPDEATP